LSRLPYIAAAIAIGGFIAIQPALNGELARRVGSMFGAIFLSVTLSFVLALVAFLILRPPLALSALPSVPVWVWLNGFIGFGFVVGTLWLAPTLGGAVLFASIVAGQMIVAVIADHYGFGGYNTEGIDAWRIAGIVLVVGGVLAFQRGG
jgi:transporter family-2 protein